MPFGDGTGPMGQGPMTGRGAGYCTGFSRPVFNAPRTMGRWFNIGWPRWGRRSGRGRGFGRYAGYRSWW